jgi:oligosaccharide 4-alpha-D-glucosyltransferase
LTARIQKKPFNISYYKDDEWLISEHGGFFTGVTETAETEQQPSVKTAVHGIRFKVAKDEQFIGAGERVLGMNRRGYRLPLYNKAHYGYETYSEQMNFSLPALMSNKKYMILFDNTAKGWLDIAKTESNIVQFEAVAGRNAYVIIAGQSYKELLKNYVDVTGKQPMPPRWALGNFASRFGYRSQAEVMATVEKFQALDVPLDAVVIDLFWFGKNIKGHMGNLAWDKQAFPTPEKMIADLKKKGIKTILITEPFVLTSSDRWQEVVTKQVLAKDAQGQAKTFDFYFGNTGIIDLFNPQGRAWFNEIYEVLDRQGISGWWGDLGEPEVHPSTALHTLDDGSVVSADAIHNAYGHQWAKMLYQHMQSIKPTERPFILMRSGFLGSQRYGMIPWTGDVNRTWGGLKPQVELSLQMAMFGLGYTHSDLGGFAGGETFDQELYIRWLQYGVFQPIYRPHGQENIPSEVVFHDQQTRDIVGQAINLRYRLLPYHYTMAYQNSNTGMPLMRPLFIDDSFNMNDFDQATSYMWGDAFFITPIVKPAMKTITIDLPQGVWFNYYSGKRMLGGKAHKEPVVKTHLPVYVKAGAFIPMIDAIDSTDQYTGEAIALHYYADDSVQHSQGEMYEDDGLSSHTIRDKAYTLMSFNADNNNQALTLSLTTSGKGYVDMPEKRALKITIHNWSKQPNSIEADGQKIAEYDWDTANNTLTFDIAWQMQATTIKVNKYKKD